MILEPPGYIEMDKLKKKLPVLTKQKYHVIILVFDSSYINGKISTEPVENEIIFVPRIFSFHTRFSFVSMHPSF